MRASRARSGVMQCAATLSAAILGCALLTSCGGDDPTGAASTGAFPSTAASASGASSTPGPSAPGASVPAPSTSPPVAPTSTAPPAVPREPTSARSQTPEGATIFITHYVAVLNHAFQVGNPRELAVFEGPDCSECRAQATAVTALGAKGHRASRPAYGAEVGPPPRAQAAPYVVPVTLTRTATPLLDRAGRVVGQLTAATVRQSYVLTWTGLGWQVTDIRKAA